MSNHTNWTEVIEPKSKWFDLKLGELWRYKDLIGIFVYRDFVSQYKQTVLGPLWHIIQPLLTTITFFIVFGNIANLSTGNSNKFLFYLAGVTVWNYFAGCINRTSGTFLDNASIFGKVYFPRLTVPISNVISGLLAFGVQFGVFLAFWLYFVIIGDLKPNIWILALPLFLFIMALLGLGIGIIISSLTIKYRDLKFLVAFGVQLLMYVSPVIYPLVSVPEKARIYLLLNPVTPVLEGFKFAFLGEGTFSVSLLVYSLVSSVVVFLIGIALFHKVEKTFMDTV